MNRLILTTMVRANGGSIICKGKEFTVYKLPLKEEEFLEFRELIPFLSVWHGGRTVEQRLTVFFNKLK